MKEGSSASSTHPFSTKSSARESWIDAPKKTSVALSNSLFCLFAFLLVCLLACLFVCLFDCLLVCLLYLLYLFY